MGLLTLIRGLPGSGKSTLASHRGTLASASRRWSVHHEADQWMVDSDGNYDFDPTRLSHCHRSCLEATRCSIEQGISLVEVGAAADFEVIVANTFTRLRELKPYLDLHQDFMNAGMTLDLQVITVMPAVPLTTLAARNVHGVPLETLARMAARWEEYPTETMVVDANLAR